jgi:hypothetical protein
MLYYWKHVVGLQGEVDPRTTLELPGQVIRQAWRVVARRAPSAEGGANSTRTGLREAGMVVWRTWLAREGADTDDVLKGLTGYAGALARILEGFESGRVRKRDGSRYKQPRMSRAFKDMARSAGLPALAAELDKKLLPALHLVPAKHPLYGRYTAADAFCDSLDMAERLSRPGESPAHEAVLGVDIPVQVRAGGWILPAVADMLIIADGNGADPPAVVVEVHDFEPGRPPLARQTGRDLRVIAALHMEPLAGGTPQFGEVTGVTYRHVLSGWKHFRRRAGIGRFTAVLEAALRGIQEAVYTPMFLMDLERCRACPMQGPCFNSGGLDALEALSPGLTTRAEAVAGSVRAVSAGLNAPQRKLLLPVLKRLTAELEQRGGLPGDLPGAVRTLERGLSPVALEEG